MTFKASVYRVLIASPGDLSEERGIIEDVIYDWNATHAIEDQVVLLPVRWETHSVPELGDRPQGILNRRLVAGCDILIGAFWTRLGTPTGVSDSGTMEEIEQFLAAEKPVLLYFSSRAIDPDRVDLDQLKHLREAKSRLMKRGLIEQFASPSDLRWKLSRHLHEQVRRMAGSSPEEASERAVPRAQQTKKYLQAIPLSHPEEASERAAPKAQQAQNYIQAIPVSLQPLRSKVRLDETALGELYASYWEEFSAALTESRVRLRPPTPTSHNYARLSLGSSDMRMNVFASVRDRFIGVELVLRKPACDEAYSRLKGAQAEIEQELGQKLQWNEPPRSFRIALVERGFDPVYRGDWGRQHQRLIEMIQDYQKVLLPRIAR